MIDEPALRGIAILTALRADGSEAETLEIQLPNYDDGGIELLDSDEYRASRSIRIVQGRIVDLEGNVRREFVSEYAGHQTDITS